MKKLSDLEYLKLNKFQRLGYNFLMFLAAIPLFFVKLGKGIVKFFVDLGIDIKDGVLDIFRTFRYGNWAVKLSFLIFGAGNLYYGQILRGLFFLLFEAVFFAYMFIPSGGIHWLSKVNWFQTGQTIGTVQGGKVVETIDFNGMSMEVEKWVSGDDSVKVLLYGLLTVAFIVAFIWTWRLQLKQCSICMDITAKGKKVKSGKDDLKSLLDDQFHKTLLSLPVVGILVFTVLPIIFMVLVAFTSYDAAHDGYANLFSWVGWDHFNELFNFGEGGLGIAFGEILSWTLMWSFFAPSPTTSWVCSWQ
jgi:arabinogalactan oligomer/maltooligosaccharide transport system permease protein